MLFSDFKLLKNNYILSEMRPLDQLQIPRVRYSLRGERQLHGVRNIAFGVFLEELNSVGYPHPLRVDELHVGQFVVEHGKHLLLHADSGIALCRQLAHAVVEDVVEHYHRLVVFLVLHVVEVFLGQPQHFRRVSFRNLVNVVLRFALAARRAAAEQRHSRDCGEDEGGNDRKVLFHRLLFLEERHLSSVEKVSLSSHLTIEILFQFFLD